MVKKITSLNIDSDVVEKAKRMGLNLSDVAERAIKSRCEPTIKDIPENALKMKCMQCFKEIEYGFLCEDRNLFLCQECQDKFNMSLCPHDIDGSHEHIRIPGFNNQNSERIEKIKLITNENL